MSADVLLKKKSYRKATNHVEKQINMDIYPQNIKGIIPSSNKLVYYWPSCSILTIEVWLVVQQQQYYLGVCKKCRRISGLTQTY